METVRKKEWKQRGRRNGNREEEEIETVSKKELKQRGGRNGNSE